MKCRFLLFVLFLSSGIGFAQKSTIDSLKRALREAPSDKKIDAYQSLIVKLWLNQPDTAMRYAEEAIVFSQSRNAYDRAVANRMKGAVFFYLDQFDSAIKYNYRSVLLSAETQDTLLTANSMNNVGLAFFKVGNYPSALEYSLRSLHLKRQLKKNNALGRTLINVGLIYAELKQYEIARGYFNEAVTLAKSQKDSITWMYGLNNLGLSYLNEKKISDSETFFKAAEDLERTIDNAVDKSTTYCGLARVAMERGEFKKARNYLVQSLHIRQNIKEQSAVAETYFYFAEAYKKTGRVDSAFYFLKKSIVIARQVRSQDIVMQCYQSFIALFAQLKKYDSAFFYQTKFIAHRDSLFTENLARNITNIQLQLHDEESRTKLDAKDQEIISRRNQAYVIAGFAVVIMIAAIGFYRSRNRERRFRGDLAHQHKEIQLQKEELQLSNAQLARAHEVISRQKSELEEYNLQLQSTVDTRTKELEIANRELSVVNLELDNFIYKSSHDIKGPLARLIGLCHVALLDVSDPKAKQYLLKLSENAKNLNEIFDRLRTVSDIDSIELSHEKIHFKEMISRIKFRLKSLDGYNEITFKEEVENLEFQSDPFLLETIFHNLIENAVKFQKKSNQFNKFISITVKRENGSVHVSFIDNGIGIGMTDDKELFTMFTNAALEHKTIGLGLYIVKQCAAKLHGTVRIVPNPHQYTEFELTLPFEQSS